MALLAVHGLVGLAPVPDRRPPRAAGVPRRPRWRRSPPWSGSLTRMPGIVDGDVDTEHVAWVGPLGLALDLRLDGFAALMVLLVAGIGVLVFAYALALLRRRERGRLGRLLGLLVLFAGAMLGLVLADNLLVLYGVLGADVGHVVPADRQRPHRRRRPGPRRCRRCWSPSPAAWRCSPASSSSARPPAPTGSARSSPTRRAGTTVDGRASCCILLGAFTKSAQYPFHSWLPGAMVAPTPVSAYLHSATMVKAGVYLVARFAPAFADRGALAAARRSPSASSRWSPAACARCASTTSSCCSPTAR